MRKAALAGIAAVVCGAVYALAQGERPRQPPMYSDNWEYKVETLAQDGSGKFDELGKDRWELVAVTAASGGGGFNNPRIESHAYFKRHARIVIDGPAH